MVGGVAQTHDRKITTLSHKQPPNAETLIMFMWGAAGHPVWVTHEMVLEDHQLAYFCNGLIDATAAKPKVTSGQTALRNNDENVDWNCDFHKQNSVILTG